MLGYKQIIESGSSQEDHDFKILLPEVLQSFPDNGQKMLLMSFPLSQVTSIEKIRRSIGIDLALLVTWVHCYFKICRK